jgi:hypothetical protein
MYVCICMYWPMLVLDFHMASSLQFPHQNSLHYFSCPCYISCLSEKCCLYNFVYLCYTEVPTKHRLLSKIMIFWDVTHCSCESRALLQWVTVWSAVLVRCTLSWGCGTSVWIVCTTTCVRLVSSWAGLARGTSWGTQCRNIVTRQVWQMSNYRQHMFEAVMPAHPGFLYF